MNTNFMQVVPMTDGEKIAMYMKLTKKELANMMVQFEKMALMTMAQNQPYQWMRVDDRPTFASTSAGKPINMQH